MSKLKQIESFVQVAQKGSLTAVAQLEDVAPAIIGRRIDKLEERLGVKLLVRTTRRLTLTPEGNAFLEDCQRLLTDLADAEANVASGSLQATGHLRITAPAVFGRQHVAPLIPQFVTQHTQSSISLHLSERTVDIFNEGFDCAICVDDLPESNLINLKLADNQKVCVASPAWLDANGRPEHPNDLLQVKCLTLGVDSSRLQGWNFKVEGQSIVMRPRTQLSCSDGEILHRWCLDGLGVAWRSVWEISDDLKAGRLIPILRPFEVAPQGIYAVFSQNRHLPLRVRLWIDFLRESYIQQTENWSLP